MRSKLDIQKANFDFNIREMLQAKDKKLEEEANAKYKSDRDALKSHVYVTEGAYLHNQREKKNLLERRIGYSAHMTELALTEALTYIIENALLLNTEEYEKLNPNYKTEIEETVRGFVENSEIDENYDNQTILKLYESLQKDLPSADLYLTEEEEEKDFVYNKMISNSAINKGLDQLTRDVRARVANIVSKEQDALAKEDETLQYAGQRELDKAPMVPVETAPQEDGTVDQGITPLADPESDTAQQVQDTTEPVGTEVEGVRESFNLVHKKQHYGIVETLAINEANEMLSAGKPLDKNLALANAVKLLTIFETLDATGIVRFGPEGYNRIVAASGRSMNPVAKTDLPGEQLTDTPVGVDTPVKNDVLHDFKPEMKEVKSDEVKKDEKLPIDQLPETKKEAKLRKDINDLPGVKDVRNDITGDVLVSNLYDNDTKIFKPFADWKKEHGGNEEKVDIPPVQENLHGKYTNYKGQIFTESQLRNFFDKEGFDLNYVDFDALCQSYNFVKH